MKRYLLIILTIGCIFTPDLMAGTAVTGQIDEKGNISISTYPGLYADYQLGVQNRLHFGSAFGYKTIGEILNFRGAKTVIWDAFVMYRFYEVKNRRWQLNVGVLGGLFLDDAELGQQIGITTELFYLDDYSLRVNPIFGPRAGIEFVYHYSSELNLTAGFSGISGGLGIEIKL